MTELSAQSESEIKSLPFRKLYQFACSYDYLVLGLGALCATAMGVMQPFLFYYVGEMYTEISPDSAREDFYDKAVECAYILMGFGAGYTLVAYLAVVFFVNSGSCMANHFRREYMAAVLRQDPEWFDSRAVAELPNALTADTTSIEKATGDKLVTVIFTLIMVLASMAISISKVLQLTLVGLAFAPVMIGGLVLANKTLEETARRNDAAYKTAGGIAEETMTEIKTVAAHNAQCVASDKYVESLKDSYTTMLVSGLKVGIGMGTGLGAFLCMIAALVITAATLIRDEKSNWASGDSVDLGNTLIVMLVCMMAFNNVGVLAPCVKSIAGGCVAGAAIINVIHSQNQIKNGRHSAELKGIVEFKNVDFAYPSAPQKPILRHFSFDIKPGDTLAILGETGSGKSTVISLLMRFYDRNGGDILVDGVDIKEWNLELLRGQVGLVSQEPILFNATIRENILFGKPAATDAEIEEAVRKSEVLDFIVNLPEQFHTNVGSKGSQLSGGERQRIAIARAIIRCPKLLLLDESTSALDKNTEASVQTTLNTLMSECTTIMIAHRISTIRKATKVIVVTQGEVAEMGTQEELIAKQGKFYHTMMMQNIKINEEESEATSPVSSISTSAMRRKAAKSEAPDPNQPHEQHDKGKYGSRLRAMAKGNMGWLVLGVLGSVLGGVAHPVDGLLLGLEVQTLGQKTGDELEDDSRFYGGMIVLVGLGMFLGMVFQSISYPLMSARMTRTMRRESFQALLYYDLAFFDVNNPTVLSTQLSSDCEKVNGLGGSVIGLLIGIVCSLAAAYTISRIYCWQIMLIILATFPINAICSTIVIMSQGQGIGSYKYEDATIYASDCILNYKTVKAFGMEQKLLASYMQVCEKASKVGRKKAHISGFMFGLGYGILYFLYALMFWFAAYMFREDIVEFDAMNIALFAGMSGTSSVFLSVIFAPDLKHGQTAAKNLFKILDYEPTIDSNSANGLKTALTGAISFEDVSFKYPTREIYSLSNVCFSIPAGSTFAIVGTTGSGKSTIIQLLLRFYDATEGFVKFDGVDIRDFNVKDLRSQIAIVGQEPVLFTGSVRSNIAFGIEASEEDIRRAAEQAQALPFISNHPDSFNREVGLRGSHLSGGEKQRVAIARAVIRKPKLLILDEATSALDSDTEAKLVDILGGVMRNCTCVIVAHRIKTIATMDQIAVLSNGELLEIGSFGELMEKKGSLYSLAMQR